MYLVYKKRFLNYLWFSLAYFGYVIVHFGKMENKINLNPSELFPVATMREYHILGIISGVFFYLRLWRLTQETIIVNLV